MKCPKCGYHRQPIDDAVVPATDCPACGIVYAKCGPTDDPLPVAEPSADGGGATKPSAVHASSLKQARDRVETRLRDQARTRLEKERKAQTLERARQITLEAIRRRQLERQGQSTPPSMEDSLDSDLSAERSTDPLPVGHGGVQSDPGALADATGPPSANENETPEPSPGDLVTQTAGDEGHAPAALASPHEIDLADPDGLRVAAVNDVSMAAADESQGEDPMPVQVPINAAGSADRSSLRWLRTAGFLVLFAGMIGAVLSWTTIGGGDNGPVSAGSIPAHMAGTVPVGLLLGLAYLTTGVLGFAFFWTSSIISAQLTEIRLLLSSAAQPSPPMASAGDIA